MLSISAPVAADVEAETPQVVLTQVGFDVSVEGLESGEPAELMVNNVVVATSIDGTLSASDVVIDETGRALIETRQHGAIEVIADVPVIAGWISILPPFIAILLAFILRSVIPALFVGLLVGAWAINGLTPTGAFVGFFDTVAIYIVDAAIDRDRMTIMMFTFLIGGMVGIVSRNGGMVGIVQRIIPYANTPKRGQGIIASLGLAIFFDDYANTMIVGNATRKVSDSLKISREKLAYLVDSTAAPVATIAVITTWIGFQLGLIESAIDSIPAIEESAYLLFLNSIAYSFYPFLAIFFVFLVVFTGKDFGPMYDAEKRARTTGAVSASAADAPTDSLTDEFYTKDGVACYASSGLVPIVTLVGTVVAGLFISGEGETLTDIIGSADSYSILVWASLLSCAVAATITLSRRLLTLNELIEAWLTGARFMLTGLVLLVMAWAVADVAEILQTAPYLISVLGDSLSPYTLPAIVFLLAAATAFASGSSWGVMAILMPLVIPLAWAVLEANGIADASHMHILYSCIACVLTGAVWADHCSPISDTTVLSSLATGCDHMDHVRTQIPYALLGGLAALLIGVLPTGFGLPWFFMLPMGAAALFVTHRFLGKPTDGV